MTARKPIHPDGFTGRTMKARKTSTCELCGGPILVGALICQVWQRWVHCTCLIARRAEWRRAIIADAEAVRRAQHR